MPRAAFSSSATEESKDSPQEWTTACGVRLEFDQEGMKPETPDPTMDNAPSFPTTDPSPHFPPPAEHTFPCQPTAPPVTFASVDTGRTWMHQNASQCCWRCFKEKQDPELTIIPFEEGWFRNHPSKCPVTRSASSPVIGPSIVLGNKEYLLSDLPSTICVCGQFCQMTQDTCTAVTKAKAELLKKQKQLPREAAPTEPIDKELNEPIDDRITPSNNQETSPPAPPQPKPVPPKPPASIKTERTNNVKMGEGKRKERPDPAKTASQTIDEETAPETPDHTMNNVPSFPTTDPSPLSPPPTEQTFPYQPTAPPATVASVDTDQKGMKPEITEGAEENLISKFKTIQQQTLISDIQATEVKEKKPSEFKNDIHDA